MQSAGGTSERDPGVPGDWFNDENPTSNGNPDGNSGQDGSEDQVDSDDSIDSQNEQIIDEFDEVEIE